MSPFPNRPQLAPSLQARTEPLQLRPQYWFTAKQQLELDDRLTVALLPKLPVIQDGIGRKPLFGRHR
jgi:hypothetical protein